MENQIKNYKQDQKTGNKKQTVIVDDQLTGETDELDPLFEDDETNSAEDLGDDL